MGLFSQSSLQSGSGWTPEGQSNEGAADEPSASVGNGVEKCGDHCESSKVR